MFEQWFFTVPSLRQEISTQQVAMYPELPFGYGLGLIVGRGAALGADWYDVRVWQHGGNTKNFTSLFLALPEQRFAISILSNGNDADFTASAATAIATLVDLPAPSPPPALPFDASKLDGLTGTYADTLEGMEVTITRSGDALAISIPVFDAQGIPYAPVLQPQSTYVWIATVGGQPLDFAFIATEDGMYMRNRDAVLLRR